MAFSQIVKKYSGKFAAVLILMAALAPCLWASEESEAMGRYFFPVMVKSHYIMKEPVNPSQALTARGWEAMMKGRLMRSAAYSTLPSNLPEWDFP